MPKLAILDRRSALSRAQKRAKDAIVRRLGVEPAEELRSARSPRELSSLVHSSAQSGTLDRGTAALLDRSLRFTDRVAAATADEAPRSSGRARSR